MRPTQNASNADNHLTNPTDPALLIPKTTAETPVSLDLDNQTLRHTRRPLFTATKQAQEILSELRLVK